MCRVYTLCGVDVGALREGVGWLGSVGWDTDRLFLLHWFCCGPGAARGIYKYPFNPSSAQLPPPIV
jgi:hypothetical protein